MKKLLFVALSAVLALGMFSCKKNDPAKMVEDATNQYFTSINETVDALDAFVSDINEDNFYDKMQGIQGFDDKIQEAFKTWDEGLRAAVAAQFGIAVEDIEVYTEEQDEWLQSVSDEDAIMAFMENLDTRLEAITEKISDAENELFDGDYYEEEFVEE